MASTNAKLIKNISGVVTDLMVQSNVDNVIYSGNVTLADKLAEIVVATSSLGTIATLNEISYANLATTLKTLIDAKATTGATLAAYGINDAYTKTQVDNLIASFWTFKGVVNYQNLLPSTGNRNGDVWQVLYEGTSGTVALDAEFAWNGTAWVLIGTISTAVDLSGYVPITRTINGKALNANFSLAASDVGAVPTTRTVNGQVLSADITLNASHVSAVPTTRTVNGKVLSADITLTAANVGAGRVLSGTSATPPEDMTENDLYIQTL